MIKTEEDRSETGFSVENIKENTEHFCGKPHDKVEVFCTRSDGYDMNV